VSTVRRKTQAGLLAVSIFSSSPKHALFLIRYSLFLYRQHAKRLFPLQISPKDTVIWAFWDTDTWTIVDKAILEEQSDSLPANVEKLIGFEGRPDPSSGTCPLCVCARSP
jgi:hypothetical protein